MLLAGAYSGDLSSHVRAAKVAAFREIGLTHVISFMEADELDHSGRPFAPYAPEFEALGVAVQRHPIRDVTAPSVALVTEILDDIDDALLHNGVVYVHCWGGRGRTGTIIGCWMVRHGWVAPDDAVAELALLRSGCVDARIRAPDTSDQVARVTGWRSGQ